MTPRTSQEPLRGRSVLIAHEDGFHGNYVGDVIAGSGARIAGVVADAGAAMALLNSVPALDALVLSRTLPGVDLASIVEEARARRIAILLIGPPRSASRSLPRVDDILTGPYAGFQVVEALVHILARQVPDGIGFHGPQRRGH